MEARRICREDARAARPRRRRDQFIEGASTMGKNIILCLDGTWNGPDSRDDSGNQTPTNVQKVFEALSGSELLAPTDDEKEFALSPADGGSGGQVGKYIHGIGDSNNVLAHAVEGAVGLGLVARVVRGYTYLSRVYQPGDDIFVLGFSRGAYTARALAGFVTHQGLLDWNAMQLVAGSEESYSAGLAAWQQYKKAIYQNKGSILQDLAQVVSDLHDRFDLGLHPAPKLQFVNNVGIAAVGVWDTVGALGIPDIEEQDGSAVRVDVFQFCDTALNASVAHGFHAVAIDEQRVDFTPTLWAARDGVVQVLFAGAHADVGGGYALAESGLSNAGLAWMARQMASVGVQFAQMPAGEPDAAAIQHQPWATGTLKMKTGPRQFPPGLRLSQRVLQRIAAGKVPVQLGADGGALYRPKNIVNSYVMLDWSGAAPHVVVEP
jgi:uncharacterized protein (DUF2235 family)